MTRSQSRLDTDTSTAKGGWPRPQDIFMSGLLCRPGKGVRPRLLSNNGLSLVLRPPNVLPASRRRFSRSMALRHPRRRRQRRLLSPRPLNPRHRLGLRPLRALPLRSTLMLRRMRASPLRQLFRPNNPDRRRLLRSSEHQRSRLCRLPQPQLNRAADKPSRLPRNKHSLGQSRRVRILGRTTSRRRPRSSMLRLRAQPARPLRKT
jgi:hypothetical protein